jgi:hypothetical protein
VLVDTVLTQEPKGDWIHGLFLALLPDSKVSSFMVHETPEQYWPS